MSTDIIQRAKTAVTRKYIDPAVCETLILELIKEIERINKPPQVTGVVRYSVTVVCPNCHKALDLAQFPYGESDGELGIHHELGLALFGTTTQPAKWGGLAIGCKCTGVQ